MEERVGTTKEEVFTVGHGGGVGLQFTMTVGGVSWSLAYPAPGHFWAEPRVRPKGFHAVLLEDRDLRGNSAN